MDSPTETPIDKLAALQETDRRLRDKAGLLRNLQREITDLETQRQVQHDTMRTAVGERDSLDVRRREIEERIEAEETKMKDRRMRLNRVRNEKELQALRREIELGKEANQQSEEELLGIFESLEKRVQEAEQAEQAWAELQQTSDGQLQDLRERVTRLQTELEEERRARNHMAESLEAGLRRKYEQIFERRGGSAVVEVRNGTCLGCHMNLPPQFFNELQRARDIRLCPNCHRILFWRPERVESSEPER